MNNLLSYFWSTDSRMRTSDLPLHKQLLTAITTTTTTHTTMAATTTQSTSITTNSNPITTKTTATTTQTIATTIATTVVMNFLSYFLFRFKLHNCKCTYSRLHFSIWIPRKGSWELCMGSNRREILVFNFSICWKTCSRILGILWYELPRYIRQIQIFNCPYRYK